MAPEVLLDGRVSKAADAYAFGITLWELFTAGRPYEGMAHCVVVIRNTNMTVMLYQMLWHSVSKNLARIQ